MAWKKIGSPSNSSIRNYLLYLNHLVCEHYGHLGDRIIQRIINDKEAFKIAYALKNGR